MMFGMYLFFHHVQSGISLPCENQVFYQDLGVLETSPTNLDKHVHKDGKIQSKMSNVGGSNKEAFDLSASASEHTNLQKLPKTHDPKNLPSRPTRLKFVFAE